MGCGYNMYNTDTHLHNLYNFGCLVQQDHVMTWQARTESHQNKHFPTSNFQCQRKNSL